MIENVAVWVVGNIVCGALIATFLIWIAPRARPAPRLVHLLWLFALLRLLLPSVPALSTTDASGADGVPLEQTEGRRTLFVFGGQPGDPTLVDDTLWFFSHGAGLRIAQGFGILWCAGALAVLARQLQRARRVSRELRKAPPAPPSVQRAVQRAAKLVGVTPPDVRALPGGGAPFVTGCWNPTLAVPAERPHWDLAVLVHELAHVGRRDVWVGWLTTFVVAAHWWNPLAWFIAARLQTAAELACDARVIALLPNRTQRYARTLVELAESDVRTVQGAAPVSGHLRGRSARELGERLRALLAPPVQVVGWQRTVAMAAALVLGTLPLEAIATEIGLRQPEATRARHGVDARLLESSGASSWSALLDDPSDAGLELRGLALMSQERYEEASLVFAQQVASKTDVDRAHYNRACALALLGRTSAALASLRSAVESGFAGAPAMDRDPDLRSLQTLPEFRALVERVRP